MPYGKSKAQAAINVVLSIGPSAPSYTGSPIAITGSITTSSASVTSLSSTVGLYPGQAISGTGIPVGATIASINTGASTLVLSAPATATTSSLAISVDPFVPMFEHKQAGTSGQKWDTEDVTNFQSGSFKEWIKTLRDSGNVPLSGNRVSTDPGQILLRAAFDDTAAYMFKLQYPKDQDQTATGDSVIFAALVDGYDDDVKAGKAIQVTANLKRTGGPTYTEGS